MQIDDTPAVSRLTALVVTLSEITGRMPCGHERTAITEATCWLDDYRAHLAACDRFARGFNKWDTDHEIDTNTVG